MRLRRILLRLHLLSTTTSGLRNRLRADGVEDGLLHRTQIRITSIPHVFLRLPLLLLLRINYIWRSFQKALNLKGSSFNALRKASSLPKWVTVCIRRRTYGHGQPKWKRDEFDTKNIASIEEYVQDGRGFVPGFVESQVVVHGLDLEQEEAGIRQCTPQRRVVLSRLPYQLFLDFSCQYINRLKIMRHLWSLDNESAYLTIEGMLSAMTSFLYTKDDRTARLDFKNATPLLILRRWTEILITYATLIAVISLVHTDSHKETYSGTEDTWVTFVLLYGTLVLELVYTGLRSAFQDKFSGKILQHNLIGLVAHNKGHSRLTRIAACLGCKELVDEYFWHMKPNYSSCRDITELVRGHVRSGWLQYIRDASCYRKFNDSRGDWTLAMNACPERLDWSIQMPFDESIILWHLATDLCFHRVAISPDDLECARQCKVMSNYMMHLLFENPEMLMPGSRRNLLSGACDELHQLLQDDKTPRDERGFTLRVMEIFDAESESVIHPGQDEPVNPNLCMTNNNSIVHNAWRLAKILLCLCDDLGDGGGQTRMWKELFPAPECLRAFDCLVAGSGGRRREVLLLLDDNGELTHAMGVELDLSDKPVGLDVQPAAPARPQPHGPSAAAPAHDPAGLPAALVVRPPQLHTSSIFRLKEEDGGDVPSGWLPVEKGRVRLRKIGR
ncbi:Peroxiredoxin-2E-1, chloroplastic [Hordeum vulgare]|nr:Peroxiredoxin-2E-1, chloroplastic [Hordeum vulgare]